MDRVEHRLMTQLARASHDFALLEPGDRVMVAVSGGKDSHALLYLLREVKRRAPFDFSLVAVNVDQGHPGFPKTLLPDYFRREGYEFEIVEEDTYSIVKEKIPAGKTTCSLCSRLRRGILYTTATRLGATKIALGHHRDDVIETLLLNLFFSGQTKAMPPRLRSDDGKHVVIRPLVYVTEAEARAYCLESQLPIIGCCCPACGDLGLQRQRVKRLIAELEREHPQVKASMIKALGNVMPRHLLDRRLNPPAETLGQPDADVPAELSFIPLLTHRPS